MMTVEEVYRHFLIPNNLQEHMLRVGALAHVLTTSWNGEDINTHAVIEACLLHDIAKPMDFDLGKQAAFGLSEEDVAQLADLQDRLRTEFGENEHTALVRMCEALSCGTETVRLLNALDWAFVPRLIAAGDVEALVPIYCDMRISPSGILSLSDRVKELSMRENISGQGKIESGLALEKLICDRVDRDVNTIRDDELESQWDALRNFNIGS